MRRFEPVMIEQIEIFVKRTFDYFQSLQPLLFANIFNYRRLREYHELVTKMIVSRLSRERDAVHDFYSIVAGEIDTKADDSIGSNDL